MRRYAFSNCEAVVLTFSGRSALHLLDWSTASGVSLSERAGMGRVSDAFTRALFNLPQVCDSLAAASSCPFEQLTSQEGSSCVKGLSMSLAVDHCPTSCWQRLTAASAEVLLNSAALSGRHGCRMQMSAYLTLHLRQLSTWQSQGHCTSAGMAPGGPWPASLPWPSSSSAPTSAPRQAFLTSAKLIGNLLEASGNSAYAPVWTGVAADIYKRALFVGDQCFLCSLLTLWRGGQKLSFSALLTCQ